MEEGKNIQLLSDDEMIQNEFNALLNDYLNTKHRKRVEIITKAFHFANQSHKGIRRKSGEPYIMHPLAVARVICAEMGLGSTSICAALLHDIVEDTEYTVADIRALFGDKIAEIVDGLTKISGGIFGDKASEQAENFRKLLLTMSDDIRVILIKIADRLHNMRTLGSMAPDKQYKIAGETLYIYAPLAHRLGLFSIKTELENLSFKYEHPEQYNLIAEKVAGTQKEIDELYHLFVTPLKNRLDTLGVRYSISGRIKSIYSIWSKMQRKRIPFEEIFDLLAVRIIFEPDLCVDEKKECWSIYSAITDLYPPHPNRIRDWLSHPKANGYQALHVTVMGPKGKWIEVQIRSSKMNDIAEKGYAAHWKYKEGASEKEGELEEWLKTIKEILDSPEPDAVDFLDTIKLNLYASEIFVFTPKGDMFTLPNEATALDFAFYLHTEIGFHSIGAKVNNHLVPLSYRLKSGDQVEILTAKNQEPNQEWLSYATTAKARAKIKVKFKREVRFSIKKGEKIYQDFVISLGLIPDPTMMDRLLKAHKIDKAEDLFKRLGNGTFVLSENEAKLIKEKSNSFVRYWKLKLGTTSVDKSLAEEVPSSSTIQSKKSSKKTLQLTEESFAKQYHIAECCRPIPGDTVLGFIEKTGEVTIHKRDCPEALKLKTNYGKRIVTAQWATHKLLSFPASVYIKGIDALGLLSKITDIISKDMNVNMRKVAFETNDGIFEGKIQLWVHDTEDINNLCAQLIKLEHIKSVNRIENF